MSRTKKITEQERIASGQQWYSFSLPGGMKCDLLSDCLSHALQRLKTALKHYREEEPKRKARADATRNRMQMIRKNRLKKEREEREDNGTILDNMDLFPMVKRDKVEKKKKTVKSTQSINSKNKPNEDANPILFDVETSNT